MAISDNQNKEVTICMLQQNMHKSKEVSIEINKWLEGIKGSEGIALLQEPNNHKGKINCIGKGYNIYTTNTNNNVRAAIITTKGLTCWKLDQFCNEDQSTIALYTGANKITAITSVYMPYDSPEPPPSNTLINLTTFCEEKNWDLLVGADANSHNIAWGSSDNNNRGEKLMDFIVSTNLYICNLGTTPTFENAIRSEVIDITLATSNMMDKLIDWKVTQNASLSDHNRITFKINSELPKSNAIFRNIRKTDWEKYKSTLKVEISRIRNDFEFSELDDKAKLMENAIKKSFEASNQPRNTKQSSKPKWWNAELER